MKNKFKITVEALIVGVLILLGILSSLNKFDVPFYVFIILGVVYYASEILGYSDVEPFKEDETVLNRTVNPNSPRPPKPPKK